MDWEQFSRNAGPYMMYGQVPGSSGNVASGDTFWADAGFLESLGKALGVASPTDKYAFQDVIAGESSDSYAPGYATVASQELINKLRSGGYTFSPVDSRHPSVAVFGPDGQEIGQYGYGDTGSSFDNTWAPLIAAAITAYGVGSGLGLLGEGGAAAGAGGAGGTGGAGLSGAQAAAEAASQLGAWSAANPVTASELSALIPGFGAEAATLGTTGLNALRAGELASYATSGAMPSSAAVSGGNMGILDSLGSLFGGSGSMGNSLLNLGGNLLSGYMQSNAAGNAADAQAAAAAQANALQKYMYDTTRADYAPYRQAGTDALGKIQALLANPATITGDPGYQFGLDQGTKALQNSATGRGMTYSGQQAKALQQYGQDYAGTKLNESYNRLASLAGVGQQATGSTSAAGSNYANQAGNALMQAGNANASGYIGSNNAWTNAIGNSLNNWNQQNLLKQLGIGGP